MFVEPKGITIKSPEEIFRSNYYFEHVYLVKVRFTRDRRSERILVASKRRSDKGYKLVPAYIELEGMERVQAHASVYTFNKFRGEDRLGKLRIKN